MPEIEVQLHLYPWSVGVPEETVSIRDGEVAFPFQGSPVVSASTAATLYLPQRHERFAPFGPPFRSAVGGEYQLHETPHGVMACSTKGGGGAGSLVVYAGGERREVRLRASGARGKVGAAADGEKLDSPLARTVLAWSQFFDECLDAARGTGREDKLPWGVVLELMRRVAEEAREPRMALIVDIARKLHRRIGHTVAAARKVLVRERRLLPAGRIEETDTACLKWYVRQPGETMAQKAAANRQSLLGVARRESFDTLENKVLKDFLLRCRREGARYRAAGVGEDPAMQHSVRARETKTYERLCAMLAKAPHLEGVGLPGQGVRPNYVLQNDLRYREVWRNYLRLLRQEDEEDRMWDWQARAWADVARLLVGAALFQMAEQPNRPSAAMRLEHKLSSVVHVLREQHLGSRVIPGSEPGPFEIYQRYRDGEVRWVLEVVHAMEAADHPVTAGLGRLGGHLYLVLTPLGGGRRKVGVMWAVHAAGAEPRELGTDRWARMAASAWRALSRHVILLEERAQDFPAVDGFIVASDLNSSEAELHGEGREELPLLQVGADQRCWENALAGMTGILEQLLEVAL